MCNIDHTDNCQQAAQAATQLERERIIKLLEELEEHDWLEVQFDKLIALIKGEK